MEQIALAWGPERRYYTVSELTGELRDLLAAEFTGVWVSGEISGAKLAASGHYYFTLKDKSAQLRCVCYRMTARYLKFKPRDGIAVLARGRVDIYDARGDMQFIVEVIEPQGHGALQVAFEQLKAKLAAEGLFEQSRKRALPPLPQRIGIVTSPAGAVIRDILQILERRCPGRHIRLFPVQVQGETAAGQIAAGLGYFAATEWAEVVIVARGGGSLEDLWAFNDERVARVIAASPVPVISAVGHETDFTIADFAADLRAPTPSAAAELVSASRQSLVDRLEAGAYKLRQATRLTLALKSQSLHRAAVDQARMRQMLGRRAQRVDELDYRLREALRGSLQRRQRALESLSARLVQRDVRLRFAEARRRLDNAGAAIRQAMHLRLSRTRTALAPVAAHLEQLSPLKILDRGYAIVEREQAGARGQVWRQVVKSPQDAPPRSSLRVRVAGGEFRARVEPPMEES